MAVLGVKLGSPKILSDMIIKKSGREPSEVNTQDYKVTLNGFSVFIHGRPYTIDLVRSLSGVYHTDRSYFLFSPVSTIYLRLDLEDLRVPNEYINQLIADLEDQVASWIKG